MNQAYACYSYCFLYFFDFFEKQTNPWLLANRTRIIEQTTLTKEIDNMKIRLSSNKEQVKIVNNDLSVLKMEVYARIENMDKRTEQIQK